MSRPKLGWQLNVVLKPYLGSSLKTPGALYQAFCIVVPDEVVHGGRYA
jgi:hypothetical protein